MIEFNSERLIIRTSMFDEDGKIILSNSADSKSKSKEIDIIKLESNIVEEHGFVCYSSETSTEQICHITIHGELKSYEIKFGCEEKYRRQGYMTEALKRVMTWLKDNTEIETVFARIHKNPVSLRVLENNGFIFLENTIDSSGKWYCLNLK